MPKRHRSESSDDDGDRGSRRPCPRCPPQRHVCVMLDDWSKGYSIYKLDVDGFDGDPHDADLDLRAERLPDPPVFRLQIPDGDGHWASFAAAGTRIFAIGYSEEDKDAPVLVYDAATGGLAVGPPTPVDLQNCPRLVPAGDKVYAMDRRDGKDHFAVLAPHGRRGWAWSRLAPPDAGRAAACHAAHPDGRTVFFSAHGRGTFSFDAETEEWAWRGEWMLPFRGQAYYDGELDAWVGLGRGGEAEGRVCSCDVVPPGGGSAQPPAWKLAEETLTSQRSIAVELAHMGGGEFCLVEYRNRRGVAEDVFAEHCLLYATTFRLRYDKDGALRAAARRARCYAVRKKSNTFHWRAFGI
ncbi:hypothetical protein ACP70R_017223 [Stipagrostis hirtigluma subsp. patula]